MEISSRRWLYLPVEIKNRELESRVLLGSVAADRGYGVVIGKTGFLNDGGFPAGIFFDGNFAPHKADDWEQLTSRFSHRVVSTCEEGLVFHSPEIYLEGKSSKETVGIASKIFTWGERQREILVERYGSSNKIIATGSPRADVWLPRFNFLYDAAACRIKEQYGEVILFPSNYGTLFHAFKGDYGLKYFEATISRDSSQCERFQSPLLSEKRRNFELLLELIPLVALTYPEKNIVVRPHPSEDLEVWREFSRSWPENAQIHSHGSISPWLRAARIIIHSGCTTAIEAALLGKSIICYSKGNSDVSLNLPNMISARGCTVSQIRKLIDEALESPQTLPSFPKSSILSEYLRTHGDGSDGTLVCDQILAELDQLDVPISTFSDQTGSIKSRLLHSIRKQKNALATLRGEKRRWRKYQQQKNPGIEVQEVQDLIDKFRNNLDRFHQVIVSRLGSGAICIYRADPYEMVNSFSTGRISGDRSSLLVRVLD